MFVMLMSTSQAAVSVEAAVTCHCTPTTCLALSADHPEKSDRDFFTSVAVLVGTITFLTTG